MQKPVFLVISLFLICVSSLNVASAVSEKSPAGENPFTPKAYLNRYWDKEIRNANPKPSFLLSKASPLSAVDSASFAKLASQNALSTRLPNFCSAAELLCFPDLSPSMEKHGKDSNFAIYTNRNFTNYGTGRLGGLDSFKNYSDDQNVAGDTFRRYSRDSTGHNDLFTSYSDGTNVGDENFNTYGAGTTGGKGTFTTYADDINVPDLRFTSYSDDSNGRDQTFTAYSNKGNSGSQSFSNYGKKGNGAPNDFTNYGTDSNVIGSDFSGYGESANAAKNTFTNYANRGNNPQNIFKNYEAGGNGAIDTFTSYRDDSNVGDDSFSSYGKNSNAAKVNFVNYGQTANPGSDKFSGYGQASKDETVGFKIYGVNTTFTDYAKKGVTFSGLPNPSSSAKKYKTMAVSGSLVNRWVEPGKFFRESMVKKGTVLPMPDIRDKMPKRSFLPRSILSKLPFSSSKITELKEIFHARDNSSMEKMITDSLTECERAPSEGETKRCVGSIEDMIDFSTSVLGRNVVVRTTENVKGSKSKIMIGTVKGINGGKVTKSVSCHQSLFPYLLYYCHSVPKVRVYEADLLDANSKSKINHGVAICHIDTSAWSPTHGAFLALGSSPGRIEVCHWIFENDMTWTIAD